MLGRERGNFYFYPLMYSWMAYLKTREGILWLLCLVLLPLVYLLNLGMSPIYHDEPTRALVAMEMILSGNYATPTISGEFYYNKPPYYNWILVILFELTGDQSEWMIRLPSVIPLFLYGFSIYFFVKQFLSRNIGLMTAIMFITCGRMLVWSSMIGHIDIFYSWLNFMSFMAIYYFFQRKQYVWLFVVSYFLTAIGFLCKGLPPIVFQGITLLTVFSYQKEFKRLFYGPHFVGLGLFLLMIGAYFYNYFQVNPDMETYFSTIWNESSKRTVVEKAWYESFIHIFLFPFDTLMHLLPWSLLGIFCFRKGFVQEVLGHPFLKFCVYVFGANVIIYWLSPDTRPRYLFMLFPLLFVVFAYAYEHREKSNPLFQQILTYLITIAGIAVALGVWLAPQMDIVKDLPGVWIQAAFLSVTIAVVTVLFLRWKPQQFVLLTLLLLLIRLGFDWWVIPQRAVVDPPRKSKDIAFEILEVVGDEPLYLHPDFELNQDIIYYLTRERQQILRITDEKNPGIFYICSDEQLVGQEYTLHHDFITRAFQRHLNLITYTPK